MRFVYRIAFFNLTKIVLFIILKAVLTVCAPKAFGSSQSLKVPHLFDLLKVSTDLIAFQSMTYFIIFV